MDRIIIRDKRCTGCSMCRTACALYNDAVNNPSKARIFIITDWHARLSSPILCYQCTNPPCVPPCPIPDTIVKDASTGIVSIDDETCIGCGLCASACPFGAILQSEDRVVKCDYCGGDPQCVRFCETKAIEYVRGAGYGQEERLELADKALSRRRTKLELA